MSQPDGFTPCGGVQDLFYRWQAAWGGSMLLGTETIAVLLFNAGYPLEDVVLKLQGRDAEGQDVFAVEQELEELPRGKEITIEVPSYELPAPASDIVVTLLSARFGCTT